MDFNPLSADFFNDPYDTYRWLRDDAPVYFNEQYGFWALSRYDDVATAHRDWRTYTSSRGITLDQLLSAEGSAYAASMIFFDPPEHERLRRLVSRVFTPKAVAGLDPLIRDVVGGYADAIGDRDEFDAVADFAAPFPVDVISAILGVPDADRQQIRHWVDDLLYREPDSPVVTPRGMEAGLAAIMYFKELAAEKRRHPQDDMTSALVQAEVLDDDGEMTRLSDDDVAGFLTLLGGAGSETVTKLVGSGVVLYHRNPGEWQEVLDDPRAIDGGTEEILRYWAPSQYQGRSTNGEVTLHGVTIPDHAPVLLITGAANRDERQFEDPDRFDISRPLQMSMGFGYGIHTCLGAALARLESRVAFEEFRSRWPRYEVDHDGLRRVQMANVAGYSNVPVRVV